MAAVKNYRFLLKLIGLDSLGGCRNYFLRIVFSIALISAILLTTIHLLLEYQSDIVRSLSAFPPICAFVSLAATFWHLAANLGHFLPLVSELLDIVHESGWNEMSIISYSFLTNKLHFPGKKKSDEIIIYIKAEKRFDSVTKMSINIQVVIAILYFSPFALVAYHWYIGKYTIDSWVIYYPIW